MALQSQTFPGGPAFTHLAYKPTHKMFAVDDTGTVPTPGWMVPADLPFVASSGGDASATFVQASRRINSVTRRLADKVQDRDAAADYGIVPDGTDQGPRVAAAMASMGSTGGGRLNLRAGTFLSSMPWYVPTGVYLCGAGAGVTVLASMVPNISVLEWSPGTFSSGASDLSCGRAAGVTNVAGSTLTVGAACDSLRLERLGVTDPNVGLRLSSCTLIWVKDLKIINPRPVAGVGILIDQASGYAYGNDHYISNTLIEGDPNNQPRCAVLMQATGATWLHLVGGLRTGSGLVANPPNGQTVEQCFTSHCAWDSGSGHGYLVQPDSGGVVRRMSSEGDWTCTMGGHGVALTGAGFIDGFAMMALRSMNNRQNGIHVDAGAVAYAIQNLRFHGDIGGNSTAGQGLWDGVNIGAGICDWEVAGRIGNYGQLLPLHRYGIKIEAGASDRFRVCANLSGNQLGGLSNGSTVAPNGTNQQIQLYGA